MKRDEYDLKNTLAGVVWALALAVAAGAVIVASGV